MFTVNQFGLRLKIWFTEGVSWPMIDPNTEVTAVDDLISAFKNYFLTAVGQNPVLGEWGVADTLPMYMTARFIYREGYVSDRPVVFVFCKDEMNAPDIISHEKILSRHSGELRIYVLKGITSYTRQYLIKLKLPFIVPENQMYLPNFYIDLREKFYTKHIERSKNRLSPTAQMIAIMLISEITNELHTLSRFADYFGVSKTTISKAFNELGTFAPFAVRSIGKEHAISVEGSRRRAWEALKDYMRNPVKEVFFVRGDLEGRGVVRAGEYSLADRSMLGHPDVKTFASSKDFLINSIALGGYSKTPEEFKSFKMEYCRLEVWAYDPFLLAQNGEADVISLYLSLREDPDERVRITLDELLEEQKWYTE